MLSNDCIDIQRMQLAIDEFDKLEENSRLTYEGHEARAKLLCQKNNMTPIYNKYSLMVTNIRKLSFEGFNTRILSLSYEDLDNFLKHFLNKHDFERAKVEYKKYEKAKVFEKEIEELYANLNDKKHLRENNDNIQKLLAVLGTLNSDNDNILPDFVREEGGYYLFVGKPTETDTKVATKEYLVSKDGSTIETYETEGVVTNDIVEIKATLGDKKASAKLTSDGEVENKVGSTIAKNAAGATLTLLNTDWHKQNKKDLLSIDTDGSIIQYGAESSVGIKANISGSANADINVPDGETPIVGGNSKDKSSFIMWFEEDDNLDGKILEKREYKRVPKEELLPKAVNYDFLNE